MYFAMVPCHCAILLNVFLKPWLLCDFLKKTDVRLYAAVERGHVQFLIGRVQIVIRQTEAQEQGFHTQQVLDVTHHRNRPTYACKEYVLVPD